MGSVRIPGMIRSLYLLTRVTVPKIRCTSQFKLFSSVTPESTSSKDGDKAKDEATTSMAGDLSHPPVSTITGINEGADLSNFLYPPTFNARERRIATTLQNLLFSQEHIRRIVLYFRERNSVYTVDPTVLKPAFEFWMQAVKPPKTGRRGVDADFLEDIPQFELPKERKFYQVTTKSTKIKSGDEVETDENATFEYDFRKGKVRDILARNPLLLLIKPAAINARIKRIHDLGIISGQNDIWRIFHFAPVAFFLQDWCEFLKKFYYIQHRILEWLIDVHKDPFPTPHPAIKNARVFDLPYHVLKARFEFAIKSGLKSPVIISKNNPNAETLELGDIVLSPLPKYLKVIAPGLSEEEYQLYENYIEEKADPEDRIIEEIAQLEANSNYSFATMSDELSKRVAASVLEEDLNHGKEPLEGLLGVRHKIEVDDETESQDVLRALKDELLLKRALIGKKRANLTKKRDLQRLRLIFPGTKPYPEAETSETDPQGEGIDKTPFLTLRRKKD